MKIIDTSVWADHFRTELPHLTLALACGEVLQHPFVTGELIVGNPRDREALLLSLEELDQAQVCPASEFYRFVESHALGGTGIGFVDAHLLASAAFHRITLMTTDKRLAVQAKRLGLAFDG